MVPSEASVRLHLARLWLDLESIERDSGATTHDRTVFAWSAAAAVRGDPEAQVLLGRCFAAGRGIATNFEQARKWFRRAAAAGSSEARYRLRALRVERRGWLRHRHGWLGVIGLLVLVTHALTHPVALDPVGVLVYLGLCVAAFPLYFATHALGHSPASRVDPPTRAPRRRDYVYDRQIAAWLRRPWRILWVATEDGAFLAPLLWIGITPWTALGAGALFGLAHYPSFSARVCLIKAFEHTLVAWLVLPWAGLWSIVVGHILWDVALLGLGAWSRRRRHVGSYSPLHQGG